MSKRKTFPGITGNICPLLGWKSSSWALTDHSKLSRGLLQNNVSMLGGVGLRVGRSFSIYKSNGIKGLKAEWSVCKSTSQFRGFTSKFETMLLTKYRAAPSTWKYVEWYGEKCKMERIGTTHWIPKFICFFILKVYPISFTVSPGTRHWNTLVTQAASNSASRCVYGKWDAQ